MSVWRNSWVPGTEPGLPKGMFPVRIPLMRAIYPVLMLRVSEISALIPYFLP